MENLNGGVEFLIFCLSCFACFPYELSWYTFSCLSGRGEVGWICFSFVFVGRIVIEGFACMGNVP